MMESQHLVSHFLGGARLVTHLSAKPTESGDRMASYLTTQLSYLVPREPAKQFSKNVRIVALTLLPQ